MKEKEKKNKGKLSAGARLLAVFGLAVLLIGCKNNAKTPDKWVVEIQITEKTTTTRESSENGTETVYLINCEDAEGSQHVFELTDASMEGKFEAEEAFKELKTGKSYKFRVGWHDPKTENQPGYHPSIYGAVKLEGLNLDNLPDISGEEKKTQEKIKIIVPSKAVREETKEDVGKENTEAAERTKGIEENIEAATERTEPTEESTEPTKESTVRQGSAETASEKQQVPQEGEEQGNTEPESVDEALAKEIEERVAQSLQESFEAEKKELEDAVRSLEERIGNIEREGQQAENGA